eukprot:2630254-Prymnesium_polylepis.2
MRWPAHVTLMVVVPAACVAPVVGSGVAVREHHWAHRRLVERLVAMHRAHLRRDQRCELLFARSALSVSPWSPRPRSIRLPRQRPT